MAKAASSCSAGWRLLRTTSMSTSNFLFQMIQF